MSDAHHEHEAGAHEVDRMPNARLFNLMIGFSVITLAACIGVVQLFGYQVATITDARAQTLPFSQREYLAEMTPILEGYGVQTFRVGAEEVDAYHVPVSAARQKVLQDPTAFRRADDYPGWQNSATYKAIEQLEAQVQAERQASQVVQGSVVEQAGEVEPPEESGATVEPSVTGDAAPTEGASAEAGEQPDGIGAAGGDGAAAGEAGGAAGGEGEAGGAAGGEGAAVGEADGAPSGAQTGQGQGESQREAPEAGAAAETDE